jgi:hypothetical protein
VANREFKTAGILRAAFEYQDLVGIEILIQFFRDSELFRWVELESDEPKAGKLDDVVAARNDGSYELLQVKFSANPSEYHLDWDWLLYRKGKGTSLLQKWSNSLQKFKSLGSIHSAKLRTNRSPDDEFLKSLNGNFVDFDKIEGSRKAVLVAELGGEKIARTFFQKFEFAHSEPLVDDLESKLKGQLVPSDTDNNGWLLLRSQASRWASRKNQPEPDGKIRHGHLVQIISKRRPKPIPQDFVVPESYRVPSMAFHDAFIARIRTGDHPISVLWGPPGRGKSTYLSYLLRELRDEDLPVVRHHYFLSLDDSTVDRVSFPEISHSLMDQMAALYPEAVQTQKRSPDQLRSWLEACGNHFASDSKPFFVIVDGLDHVWREQQNTSQMEHLFNQLLPCPVNVCLLLGTQRVPSTQLPIKLNQKADDDDWIEVPPMDRGSVHAWISGQHDAGRLLLREHRGRSVKSELAEVSAAFFDICAGNPLHLIYSFEALVRRGAIVTSEDVLEMPSCPDGDIRQYYKLLWARLSERGRKVLHTIAGCDFSWPVNGLEICGGSVHEVDHLLEHRRTGLTPFHGSVLVFAREQPNHLALVQAALPSVIRWLEKDAPEFLRWGWLWIMHSRNGDHAPLLNGASRNWVIDSLAAGWPIEQAINILWEAEEVAFAQNDLPKTWQIRSLRVRCQNGSEFQTQRYDDFEECAIRISKNEQRILSMADGLPLASENEIITLLKCLNGRDVDGIGSECFDALRGHVNRPIELGIPIDDQYLSTIEHFLESMADFGSFEPERLLKFFGHFRQGNRLFGTFLGHAVRTQNLDSVCALLPYLTSEKHASWRKAAEDSIVKIACHEGIDLQTRLTPTQSISPLLSCWFRIRGLAPSQPCIQIDVSSEAVKENYDYGRNPEIERFLHGQFFLALDAALRGETSYSPPMKGIDQSKLGWLRQAVDRLVELAFSISKDRDEIGFETIYLGLSDLLPVDVNRRPSDPDSAQYRAFRGIADDIALDLHALRCAVHGPTSVSQESFEIARGSVHWEDEIWVAHEVARRRKWIDPEGVKSLVQDLASKESKHVTSFDERTDRWVDLAQLSVIYGLDGGSEYVRRAADCMVSYGWRKDMWIFEVLSAVEYIHDMGGVDVRPWLKQLSPIVDEIVNFTDGDETNHAPEDFVELVAKVCPDWLPAMYGHFISKEDYRLAEMALAAILEQLDYSDPAAVALASSLVERADMYELEKLQKEKRSGIAEILRERRAFLGVRDRKKEKQGKKSTPKRDDLAWGGKSPNVAKFGPDKLEKLLERVERRTTGYKRREESLVRWLRHWAANGKGLEALNSIESYYNSHDNPRAINDLLDPAIEVSLTCEGVQKAYRWVVRAHIENHGWASFYSDRETIPPRLKLVAKYYKKRWNDFIQDTSSQPRFWEKRRSSFVVGSEWLVMFLVFVEQRDLAVELAKTFVQLTVASVSDQPISPAKYLS